MKKVLGKELIMKKSDFVIKTTKSKWEISDADVLSAELVDLQKVWWLEYREEDGIPSLVFQRMSDDKRVSHVIYENMELPSFSNEEEIKSLVKKPIWIAIWRLKRRVGEHNVLGQIMFSLSELVPIAIDKPPFSNLTKKLETYSKVF